MATKLFNTELKMTEERTKNVGELLNPTKVQSWITNEVKNGKLAEEGYSGKFTDRISNYIFKSKDAGSSRKGKYPFYHTEGEYWPSNAISDMRLTDDVDEAFKSNDYYRQLNENKSEYLHRLFQKENLTIDFFRNYIKLGLVNTKSEYYDIDDNLTKELIELRTVVLASCQNNTDLMFINFFDGKRKLSEVAELLGVTHQGASKRLKKICKNAEKRLRNENEIGSIYRGANNTSQK